MILNYFHLEKTGGVTFRDIIMPRYKENEVFDIKRSAEFDQRTYELSQMSIPRKAKVRLVIGHQYFGIHELFRDKMQYMTMLRSPVDRVISCYKSYRRKPGAPLHKSAMSMDIKEFIRSKVKLHFDNGMVRVLSGDRPDSAYGKITAHHLDKAWANLMTHCLFGVTEEYDASLMHFYVEGCLGDRLPFYSHANRGDNWGDVIYDTELMNLIKENNEYDMELYSRACDEFAERTYESLEGPEFKNMVDRFTRANKLLGRFMAYHRIKRKIVRALYPPPLPSGHRVLEVGEQYIG